MEKVNISELMAQSGVGFGTSGARGLVTAMTDKVCYAYTCAFLQHVGPGDQARIAISGDLRPSTPRILRAISAAARNQGFEVIYCGRIPSPALALFGLDEKIPTIMVTGSHIPDDRNGIKFNHALGEITKTDEEGIKSQTVEIPEDLFSPDGMLVDPLPISQEDVVAARNYVQRYVHFFGENALLGLRIGLYQHSSVGRELAFEILNALGAMVSGLGKSPSFIPVDTEAIRFEDIELAKSWTEARGYDAIVSMDGDADRPMLSTEEGNWLTGDTLGIMVCKALGIQRVAVPVSCNSGLEDSGCVQLVRRTRIGSPYVIEGMQTLDDGTSSVAGFEANGGFLLQTPLEREGRVLPALPTRDALLPVIAVLAYCRQNNLKISDFQKQMPERYTHADRLKKFPTELAHDRLRKWQDGGLEAMTERARYWFGDQVGRLVSVNQTDGIRMTFAGGEVIHLRASGNAPELRCYNECSTPEKVLQLNSYCMDRLEAWRDPHVQL